MISWIIYVIVGLILIFVLYLAILGINRGVEAKSMNKANNLENNLNSPNNITGEIKKLKKIFDNGVINKKEFDKAKKKLLS